MGNKKLRVINTETDNLVSNLRGEIAEIVTTWVLMRHFMASAAGLQTEDVKKDFGNPDLSFLYVLKDKLEDELVARLSELAEEKIGRLNFYFAAEKLGKFHSEAADFSRYVEKNGFRQKRNHDISHKELPEKWEGHRAPLHIPYRIILRAIASAVRVMKRIDRQVLGPSSPYLWRETRKRRYKPILSPPRVAYMMVPHFHLSGKDRIQIIQEEAREGTVVWSEMPTTINGVPTKVLASIKWGVLQFGDRFLALEAYPLVDLAGIQVPPENLIYEEHMIHTQFRCTHSSAAKLSFEPVERTHRFPDGSTTELADFTINLSDEISKNLGAVQRDDIKEFSLNVRVLKGFEMTAGA